MVKRRTKINKVVLRAYAEGRGLTLAAAEEAITDAIIRVARGLSYRSSFGYHTNEDIEQEGFVIALELLSMDPPKYDVSRPLENFLHVHIRNQLSNMKRKQYNRPERPCDCCDPYDPPAEPCRRWQEWHRRNVSKQNIMQPIEIDHVFEPTDGRMISTRPDAEENTAFDEVAAKIDSELSPDLRADYLRMRAGVNVPKGRRQKVRDAVSAIISGEGGGDG